MNAWAAITRISNLPTVLSNVLAGTAIGMASAMALHPADPAMAVFPTATFFAMCPAIALLYCGGMVLNDVMDAAVDRRERPERPIPSGRISINAARGFALACLVAGVGIPFMFRVEAGVLALILGLSIVGYNALHRRFASAAVLMGLCRGLAYLVPAAAVIWPLEWRTAGALSGALTIYVLLLTFIARGETREQMTVSRRLLPALVLVPLAPAVVVFPEHGVIVPIIAALVMILWLVYLQRHLFAAQPRVKTAVLAGLAGICLIDAFYLALLDQPMLAGAAAGLFLLTLAGHRFVAGT